MRKHFFNSKREVIPKTAVVQFGEVCVGDWIYHANRLGPSIERVLVKLPDGIVTGSTSRHGFTCAMFDNGLVTIVDRTVVESNEKQWMAEYGS